MPDQQPASTVEFDEQHWEYFVHSYDGEDYRVGTWRDGHWLPGSCADALRNLHLLDEPGAYVWGRRTSTPGQPAGEDPVPERQIGHSTLAVLEAAHVAADELDAWDGAPFSALGGCSPGGVVRHQVHEAFGVAVDECPSCATRRGD